jgi:hypothetical protein
MTQNLVSTKTEDYLDQDPPIRGQHYCCLSFISPEEVIKNKEVYFVEKFLKSYSTEMNSMFDNMLEMFKDNNDVADSLRGIKERYTYVFDVQKLNEEFEFYKAVNSTALESDYLEKNDFQTTIRGLKVRGSYESLKEAQIRAQVLKRMDDKFNVFVAEVGCWCPWSPNPEELQDQEYAETHLNTLVKQYTDNQKEKDVFFLERKEKLKALAMDDNEKNNKKYKKPFVEVIEEGLEVVADKIVETTETVEELVAELVNEVIENITKPEIHTPEEDQLLGTPLDSTTELVRDPSVTLEQVSEELTKTQNDTPMSFKEVEDKLDTDDPWLQRKKELAENVSTNNNTDGSNTDP